MGAVLKQGNILAEASFTWLATIILATGCLASEDAFNNKNSASSSSLFVEITRPLNNRPIESGCLQGCQQRTDVTVVIDVFRAFTTASYVLEWYPASYMLTTQSAVIARLASEFQAPLLIGKPEVGAILNYHIPNSPTRVKEVKVTGQHVLHRTEGGARGVLDAKGAGLILVAGLANADATIHYIKKLIKPEVKIVPMGHEATTPSLEDDICAQYIKARLEGQTINLEQYYTPLREGPGSYFFSDDQWQYPSQDFERCLELGRFNFAIKAEVQGDYAILTRLEECSY